MPKNVNAKGRRIKGNFLMLPHDVLRSDAYIELSPSAVKLLVDLGGQYNGRNNGNLCAAMTILGPRGWKSSATLQRAKNALLEAGLIQQTRQGGMNIGPNLYALTWQPIDPCEDKNGNSRHDASPSNTASGLWRRANNQK